MLHEINTLAVERAAYKQNTVPFIILEYKAMTFLETITNAVPAKNIVRNIKSDTAPSNLTELCIVQRSHLYIYIFVLYTLSFNYNSIILYLFPLY